MLDIQLGRRNLSPIQRIAVTEKYRPIYEKQARENQLSGLKQNQNTVSQNSSKRIEPEQKIDVRAKLAETAGVSTDTYSKGKKILDSDNEEVKEKVLSGEMGNGRDRPEKRVQYGLFIIRQDCKTVMHTTHFQDLIESNLRQRVLGNTNPVKLGRCFSFLNNWYGFEKGTNQHSLSKVFTSSDIFTSKTQTELAESYGISQHTMNNYMRMANIISGVKRFQRFSQ